jgi:hypothetical protein
MGMRQGRIMIGDSTFEEADIAVFEYQFMVGLAVIGQQLGARQVA